MTALRKMESLETKKEGIFVMPVERVTIHSTFIYFLADPAATVGAAASGWSFDRPAATGMFLCSANHHATTCQWLLKRLVS
jgi:hypothetical protein